VIDAGTIDAGLCGAAGTPTVVNLVNGVATYPMPSPLLQGLAYTVSVGPTLQTAQPPQLRSWCRFPEFRLW
jgi:hypothetical protein